MSEAAAAPLIVMLPGVQPRQTAEGAEEMLPASLRGTSLGGALGARPSDRVPLYFTTVESWLMRPNNLRCWHCNDPIQEFTWFIPTELELDGAGKIKRMKTHGCFCNFTCAAAGNQAEVQTETSRASRERALRMLVELQQRLPAGAVKMIYPAADPRVELAEYGRGRQSREEYRRTLAQQRRLTLDAARGGRAAAAKA